MSKFLLFCVVACFVATVISARSPNSRVDRIGEIHREISSSPACGRHGDPCTNDRQCCSNVKMRCHQYAGKCQVVITADELQAQKAKLKPTGHDLW